MRMGDATKPKRDYGGGGIVERVGKDGSSRYQAQVRTTAMSLIVAPHRGGGGSGR